MLPRRAIDSFFSLTCSPGRGATTPGGDGGQKGWEVCDSQEVPLQHFSGAISNKMFGDMKIVALYCVLYRYNPQNVSLQYKGQASGSNKVFKAKPAKRALEPLKHESPCPLELLQIPLEMI